MTSQLKPHRSLSLQVPVTFSNLTPLDNRRSDLFGICQEEWTSRKPRGARIHTYKFRLRSKERRKITMAMEIVLDLQKLEVPQEEDLFGSSTGSSSSGCCNGQQQ
jgi:hypothetical protein